MSEWNWQKNNELGLNPSRISHCSGERAWWTCAEGHEWYALISNRTKGSGCPYCSNRKVLVGYNDLATTNPSLAEEWNYEKNNNLTPQMITQSSNKKVWWICEKGHEWVAAIADRSGGCGCPECRKKKVALASSTPVYCIELQQYFPSIAEAQQKTGAKNISMHLHDKRRSAGKHPETGEKLHWVYASQTIQN